MDPCAAQEHVPIWVGGRTVRSLRRAAQLADGWCPFAVAPSQAKQWLDQMELPPNFEVVLPPGAHLDPINDPNRAKEILAETEASGATIISVVHATETLDEYLEYLEAVATIKDKE